jgi:tape measure domain-containing protein
MTDITTIGVAVETAGLVKGTKELDKFGQSADKASRQADKVGSSTSKASKSTSDMSASTVSATRSLVGLAAAYVTLNSARALIGTIDAYTKYTAQLKLATRSQDEYNAALSSVSRIANTAQADIGAIGTLYARLNNSLRDLGATQKQVADITETVGLGLKISGATAAESASAMLQLSQAFGSGVLRGEEFNAVNEAAPALMRALAESIGVPIGALREMASDGKLTSDVLMKAFSDPALLAAYQKQAEQIQTVGGAFTVLKNRLTAVIGEMDKATSSGTGFANMILALANSDFVRVPFEALAVFGANIAYVFKQVGNEIGGIAAQIEALTRLDFNAVANIRKMMVSDAKAARIEIDRVTESILNPKKAQSVFNPNAPLANATGSGIKVDEALAKKAEDARKKQNDEILKEIQFQIDLEEDLKEAAYKTESERIEALAKAREKQIKEFAEMDEKYLDIANKAHNKDLDERYKAEKDAIEKLAKEQADLAKDINKSLTDALLRGFESGKGFAENFRDTLKNMFNTLILRPVIDAVLSGSGVTKLASGIASVFSGNAMAGGGIGGGFDFGVVAQQGKSLFDLIGKGNAGIISGIEGFGATIANGLGGLRDTIGGFIGANSSLIANIAPFAGAAFSLLSGDIKGAAFQGGGAALGTLLGGPIGGGIGAALGSVVGSLFGGSKLPPRVTESRSGTFSSGQFTAFEGADVGKRKLGAASSLDGLNEVFSKQIGSLLSSFGISQSISTNSLLTKKKNVRARFNASIGGTQLGGFEESFGKKGDFNVALQTMINSALGTVTVQAIQASKLPAQIKALFDGFTDKTQVTNLINATISLNAAQKQLTSSFGITVNQSAQAAKATGLVGDALVAYVNKLTSAAMATQTLGEKLFNVRTGILDVMGNALGTVTTQAVTKLVARQVQVAAPQTNRFGIAGLGGGEVGGFLSFVKPMMQTVTKTVYESVTEYVNTITPITATLPTTLKGFDELLKSINKNSSAGIQQFNELFAIRDQFIQFTQAIDGLKGNVRGALFGMVSDAEKQQMLNADLAKLFGDLGRDVPGSIAELIALGKSIDYTTKEGLDLAAVFPSLVQAFEQTKGAVDALVSSLNPNRFRTFFDFAVASSYQRQGIPLNQLPAESMPSYAVGTSYVPNDGVAMLHQGEAVLTKSQNTDMTMNSGTVVSLLQSLVNKVGALEYDMKRTADGTQRTARELEDITGGDVTIMTEAA